MVNVRDFGAVGDGVADDRAAIQTAINSAADKVVFVPAGVYMVGNVGFACLTLPANTEFYGEAGTVLRMKPGVGPSVRLLYPGPSTFVHDLTLDGNRAAQTVDEHRAGLFYTLAPNCRLYNVAARFFTGDSIYVYNGSNNIDIQDCVCEGNGRNGITFGGGTNGGKVSGSTFINNAVQQFDSEPGSTGVVTNLEIVDCFIDGSFSNDYALTISGGNTGFRSSGWSIHDNEIFGSVNMVWADNIVFNNNVVENHTTKPAITVYRTANDNTIENNDLHNTQLAVNSLAVVLVQGTGPGSAPKNTVVQHNTLTTGDQPASFGVRAEGCKSVTVFDNVITGPSAPAAGYSAIWFRATLATEDFDSGAIQHNNITNFYRGVVVSGNGASKLNYLDVSHNVFNVAHDGYYLDDGTGALKDCTTVNNVCNTTLLGRAPQGTHSLFGDRWTQ